MASMDREDIENAWQSAKQAVSAQAVSCKAL
jgi:hypothetical protein